MGGLGGPRSGVDTTCRLCCGSVVGGLFAGGCPSDWASVVLQLTCWFTAEMCNVCFSFWFLKEQIKDIIISGPGAARTILLFHIISTRPPKQPLFFFHAA